MLLAISIGNSSVRMGLFDSTGHLTAKRLRTEDHLSVRDYADEIIGFTGSDCSGCPVAIGSVVPALTGVVSEAVELATGRSAVVMDHTHGMKMDVLSPSSVGIDRLAVSLAAYAELGAPVAVMDFGTATTVNFVGKGPVFEGGAILPGLGLMARAMSGGTAQLPQLELKAISDPLGFDTGSAMLSGIIFGTAGAVTRIFDEVKKAQNSNYLIAVTGGYSDLLLPHLAGISLVDAELALKGLRIMYKGRE